MHFTPYQNSLTDSEAKEARKKIDDMKNQIVLLEDKIKKYTKNKTAIKQELKHLEHKERNLRYDINDLIKKLNDKKKEDNNLDKLIRRKKSELKSIDIEKSKSKAAANTTVTSTDAPPALDHQIKNLFCKWENDHMKKRCEDLEKRLEQQRLVSLIPHPRS